MSHVALKIPRSTRDILSTHDTTRDILSTHDMTLDTISLTGILTYLPYRQTDRRTDRQTDKQTDGGCRWPLDHRVHPRGTSGSHVTIIADIFTAEAASHGAAGIFRPTTEKTPEKSLEQFWYEGTLERITYDRPTTSYERLRMSPTSNYWKSGQIVGNRNENTAAQTERENLYYTMLYIYGEESVARQ
ncbi:hypothetical protein DPMN_134322 [Dreissena polymorpha]|uniref:Uncharacterized protein n=1 Tax=Dreissena polymorpha TaxID=45954 RepID=A0A9D4G1T8_DREPO|nr:hypothetical protein DPMN_134322 [Dreissena polymorpha]